MKNEPEQIFDNIAASTVPEPQAESQRFEGQEVDCLYLWQGNGHKAEISSNIYVDT